MIISTSLVAFNKKNISWPLPCTTDTFALHPDDELPALSIEDKKIVETISNGITTNSKGNLQMPLPFRNDCVQLTNNKEVVFRRTRNTLSRLKNEPNKLLECR
jgi:hypothetical protein